VFLGWHREVVPQLKRLGVYLHHVGGNVQIALSRGHVLAVYLLLPHSSGSEEILGRCVNGL